MRRRSLVFLACPVLLLVLPSLASAQDIGLSRAQALQAGVVTAKLNDLQAVASVRLPAQVVVPPAQIEVIAASVPAMVASVRVAYGDAVKQGQPLLRLQGGQLLELQREHLGARAAAQLAAENRRRDEALFADVQHAPRQAIEARLAATQARLDAGEARYRLLLDAHQLWNTGAE